jgi:hypothetical protein
MTRVLLVWEDRYHDTLGPFVKRRLAARAPTGHTGFPHVADLLWQLAMPAVPPVAPPPPEAVSSHPKKGARKVPKG